MPRKPIQSVPKRQMVEEYLIVHPYASNAEVAAACGVGERTVTYARSDAVKKGLVPAAYFDRTSPLDTSPPSSGSGQDLPQVIQDKLAALMGRGGAPLTPEESLSMLATMTREAYTAKNFSLVRDCILADARIREKTEDSNLTIADPITEEEFILHTSDILDVVGPEIAAAALCRAYDSALRTAFDSAYARVRATQALPAETPGAPVTLASPVESTV